MLSEFERLLVYRPTTLQWEALIGISRQAIEEHEKQKHFVVKGKEFGEGLKAALSYFREVAAGRIKTEGNEGLIAAKTRQTEINADRQALALAKEASKLVIIADLLGKLRDICIRSRIVLQNEIPKKVAAKIELLYNIKIDINIIENEIKPVLDRYASDLQLVATSHDNEDSGGLETLPTA